MRETNVFTPGTFTTDQWHHSIAITNARGAGRSGDLWSLLCAILLGSGIVFCLCQAKWNPVSLIIQHLGMCLGFNSSTLDIKKPCCWCLKWESCDIKESRCLIQLQNCERTRLATATTSRTDASQRNQTTDSLILHDASPRWFFFFFFFCPG